MQRINTCQQSEKYINVWGLLINSNDFKQRTEGHHRLDEYPLADWLPPRHAILFDD